MSIFSQYLRWLDTPERKETAISFSTMGFFSLENTYFFSAFLVLRKFREAYAFDLKFNKDCT